MAQVGVQQPSNLMEMFSSPSLMMGDIAAQQVNDQTLGNLINRQQAQQSMDFAAQEQPFRLDELGLNNQTKRAQLPGVEADSGLKQNKLKQDNLTFDDQTKATISKLAKEISDNHLSEAENGISQMMMHPDPKIREQGKKMFPMIRAIAQERDKIAVQGAQRMKEIGAQTAGQKEIQQMQIDAGKYKKSDKYGLSFSQRLSSENDPVKKITMLNIAATEAAQAGDMDTAQTYQELAKSIEQIANQKLAALKPNQADLSQLGGIPATAQPSLVPGAKPAAAPKSFNSEADAEAAQASGQLKPGDIIIINGRRARVK